MLGKLIKHEFRATARIMLPLVAAAIVLSPLIGWLLNMIDLESFTGILKFISGLMISLFFLFLFAMCVVSLVLMIRRFYKNLLGDEGYLSFTLPVDISAIIFSKLIVSFVWFITTILACFCAGIIIISISYTPFDFSVIWESFVEGARFIGVGTMILYFFEFIFSAFLMSTSICLHFYAAMALGHSFANRKVFLSFCFFIILNFVATAVTALCIALVNTGVADAIMESAKNMLRGMTEEQVYQMLGHGFLLGSSLYFFAISLAFYIPTVFALKKHKNLA